MFHQEAKALLDQAATELRALGAQLQQHMEMGRGPMGGMMGPGQRGPAMTGPGPVSPAERPLISIMLQRRADLGLTPEQVTRLEGLRDGFAREAIRRDADLRIARLRTIEQGKALLTPEQKARLLAVLGGGAPSRPSASAPTRL